MGLVRCPRASQASNPALQRFNACISAGCHSREWREATMAVIPKPNRADYSLPKNSRPIALLECLGKLLGKPWPGAYILTLALTT
jgi:hypothetical protein